MGFSQGHGAPEGKALPYIGLWSTAATGSGYRLGLLGSLKERNELAHLSWGLEPKVRCINLEGTCLGPRSPEWLGLGSEKEAEDKGFWAMGQQELLGPGWYRVKGAE